MKSKTCGSCGTEHEGGHPCLMCNVEDSAMTTPNHNEELRPLALKIARGIFSVGDGPFKCTRIQFMSGEWPSHEKAQGGVVEPSLAAIIDEVLKRHDTRATDDLVEALRVLVDDCECYCTDVGVAVKGPCGRCVGKALLSTLSKSTNERNVK